MHEDVVLEGQIAVLRDQDWLVNFAIRGNFQASCYVVAEEEVVVVVVEERKFQETEPP